MDDKPRLYVGCALTHASEEFKSAVESLKDILRQWFTVLEFVGLVDGTTRDVYRHDIKVCIGTCDIFLAICDLPAFGVGYETGVAVEKRRIPTIAVAHEDSRVSRLALGIDAPCYEFRHYRDLLEVVEFVRQRWAEEEEIISPSRNYIAA